jgi:hypothetical protein
LGGLLPKEIEETNIGKEGRGGNPKGVGTMGGRKVWWRLNVCILLLVNEIQAIFSYLSLQWRPLADSSWLADSIRRAKTETAK